VLKKKKPPLFVNVNFPSTPPRDFFLSTFIIVARTLARTRERREPERVIIRCTVHRSMLPPYYYIRTRFYYKFNLCNSGGCPLCVCVCEPRRVRTRNRCGVPRVSGRSARLSVVPKFLATARRRLGISSSSSSSVNTTAQRNNVIIIIIIRRTSSYNRHSLYTEYNTSRTPSCYLNSRGNVPIVQRYGARRRFDRFIRYVIRVHIYMYICVWTINSAV